MIKKHIRKIVILAVFLIIGFLVYRNFTSRNKNGKTEYVRVTRGNLEDIMTISGEIDAEEHVNLRFQTAGRISWIGVKEGDLVKKYQTIASLDQKELQKNLQKELNDFMKYKYDYEQTTDTYKDQVITDTIKRIKEKAGFDLNSSVLDVELKDISLKYANLISPIEGLVVRVDSPYAGVNISLPTQAEFEIVNPKTVYFSALADQTEVIKLQEDMLGELSLDSYPDNPLKGSIKNIAFTPKTGESGTVYKIKFIFDDNNDIYKYKLGMTGDLSFVTNKKENVLYLPIKFIKNEKDKKYVNLWKNKEKEKIYIETGLETDNLIEITKGLSENDTIVD